MKNLIIILLLFGVVFSAYSNGEREDEDKGREGLRIGISLPEQRTHRWVYDKDAIISYSEFYHDDIELRFSDNDQYLQARQIFSLVKEGSDVLIVAIPEKEEPTPELLHVLRFAKENDVFIIAYNKIIKNSDAIDFFVLFDLSPLGIETTDLRSGKWIDTDELKAVLSGDQKSTYMINASDLVIRTINFAKKFSNFKMNKLQKSFDDFEKVDNGSILVPTYYLAPTEITAKNYQNILFDSELFSEDILSDEQE